MAASGTSRVLRVGVWIAVLAVAAVVGFAYGALTYHPPEPELEGMSSLEPTDVATAPPSVAPATVPDLVGRHRFAAGQELDEMGILYLVDPVKGRDDDVVVRQHPSAGSPVKPATNVLLTVRCDPRPCPQPPEGKNLYDPCACLWR